MHHPAAPTTMHQLLLSSGFGSPGSLTIRFALCLAVLGRVSHSIKFRFHFLGGNIRCCLQLLLSWHIAAWQPASTTQHRAKNYNKLSTSAHEQQQ
jgi:hypothetical protein